MRKHSEMPRLGDKEVGEKTALFKEVGEKTALFSVEGSIAFVLRLPALQFRHFSAFVLK